MAIIYKIVDIAVIIACQKVFSPIDVNNAITVININRHENAINSNGNDKIKHSIKEY